MKEYKYDRYSALNYARKFAKSRNQNYYDFDKLGGDCTNFVSQCLFAGAKIMNYTPITGWYYNSLSDRTPSWTGVEFLYNFLTKNNGLGPFGKLVSVNQIDVGDVIQLGRATGEFYHTLFISEIIDDKILVCSHTRDALDKPLNEYIFEHIRYIKILGVRKN